MAFTIVLLLSAIAAYAQAVPTYPSGRLSSVVGLSSSAVGRSLVAPIHDLHHDLHHGHGSSFNNRYDAGRLIHDTVYNPRLAGTRRFGVIGGIGSHDPLTHNAHNIPHSHVCNCGLGEVCREDNLGRSFCQHIASVNSGVGVGTGIGSRLIRGDSQRCMYLEYPRSCVRSRSMNTRVRYSFVSGRCQQIVVSGVASWCRPEGESNNIFRTRYECERYCGM